MILQRGLCMSQKLTIVLIQVGEQIDPIPRVDTFSEPIYFSS